MDKKEETEPVKNKESSVRFWDYCWWSGECCPSGSERLEKDKNLNQFEEK